MRDVRGRIETEGLHPGYSGKWLALAGVGTGVLMATLDASIVNISLPTMVEALHTNFATVQWVILSYMLVLTSMVLGVARLGDMHSKKKLYSAGLGLFMAGSLLCGLSPGVNWLIGFRALQALGGVMMQALGAAIVTEVFPTSERGRALGFIGGIVSAGLACGPAIGGVLIGLAGWRSIFLVNVPIGLIAGFLVARHVPLLPPVRHGQRFDISGAGIMLITLLSYALAMTLGESSGFGDSLVRILLLVTAFGVSALFVVENRVHQPMIDLDLFRNVLFTLNLLMGFLVFITLAGVIIFPFFLEWVKGYSTEQVGLMMMVVPISMGVLAPIAGSLSDRFGSRGISLIGLVVVAAGCLSISTLHKEVSTAGYIVRMIPLGVGLGIFQSPNNSAIMGAVPKERLGVASGLLALSRTLGQSTGLPLMGALFITLVYSNGNLLPGEDLSHAPAEALVAGITGTYRIAALIILASTAMAAAALWIESRRGLKQIPGNSPRLS
jgi:EmrB/QacA subfamily drug resistance transporter